MGRGFEQGEGNPSSGSGQEHPVPPDLGRRPPPRRWEPVPWLRPGTAFGIASAFPAGIPLGVFACRKHPWVMGHPQTLVGPPPSSCVIQHREPQEQGSGDVAVICDCPCSKELCHHHHQHPCDGSGVQCHAPHWLCPWVSHLLLLPKGCWLVLPSTPALALG